MKNCEIQVKRRNIDCNMIENSFIDEDDYYYYYIFFFYEAKYRYVKSNVLVKVSLSL